VNPRALEEADERDRERRLRRVRGPLHGIPIALKDNIHTTNMPTTGGALAFAGLIPPYEATLTKICATPGAIIIAKTTMTELANWVAAAMPTNYNSLSGFAFNPYDPRRDPRDATGDGRPVLATGGSSSGIGTAMSFWMANVGTETSGSILSPSSQNMLVGIKPTVGRVSRYGVIPIAADQDTPGTNGAVGRGRRNHARRHGRRQAGSQRFGDEHVHAAATTRLHDVPSPRRPEGRALGIPRAFYYDPAATPGERGSNGGLNEPQKRVMTDAIAAMRAQGATVIDPADIPSIVTTDPPGACSSGVCAADLRTPGAATRTARWCSSTA
jgi:amidase